MSISNREAFWWLTEPPEDCPDHGPYERTEDGVSFYCPGCQDIEEEEFRAQQHPQEPLCGPLNLPRPEYPEGDPRRTQQLLEVEDRVAKGDQT